jgi:hypothetical protein
MQRWWHWVFWMALRLRILLLWITSWSVWTYRLPFSFRNYHWYKPPSLLLDPFHTFPLYLLIHPHPLILPPSRSFPPPLSNSPPNPPPPPPTDSPPAPHPPPPPPHSSTPTDGRTSAAPTARPNPQSSNHDLPALSVSDLNPPSPAGVSPPLSPAHSGTGNWIPPMELHAQLGPDSKDPLPPPQRRRSNTGGRLEAPGIRPRLPPPTIYPFPHRRKREREQIQLHQ